MYVIAYITLDGDEYEVGADVSYDCGGDYGGPSFEVGEPDISAPYCRLKLSRLIDPDTLPAGWSELASEALIEAHEGKVGDMLDSYADYLHDCERDE